MEMTSHEGHDVFITWGFVVRACPRICFLQIQSTGPYCTPEVLKHALTSFIILFSFAARCCTPVKSVKSRLIVRTHRFNNIFVHMFTATLPLPLPRGIATCWTCKVII